MIQCIQYVSLHQLSDTPICLFDSNEKKNSSSGTIIVNLFHVTYHIELVISLKQICVVT